jgi:hypothetical protein
MPWSSVPDAPDWLVKLASGLWASFLAALIGRLMWHTKLVQLGKRKFFSIQAVWELPTVFGMMLVGMGLGEYFHLGENATYGITTLLAYYGPRGVEVIIQRWLASRVPPAPAEDQPKEGAAK